MLPQIIRILNRGSNSKVVKDDILEVIVELVWLGGKPLGYFYNLRGKFALRHNVGSGQVNFFKLIENLIDILETCFVASLKLLALQSGKHVRSKCITGAGV